MHTIHQTGTEMLMNNGPNRILNWEGYIWNTNHLKNRYVLLFFEKWTLHAQHIKVTYGDKRLGVPFENSFDPGGF